jgi:uncharacterized small protein (DUF1192 family)
MIEDNNNTSQPIDVSADSELTPITQQPIDKVNANEWSSLSLTEMHEQLTTLQNRYYACLELEKYEVSQAIQQGINRLRAEITKKSDQQPNKSGV